MNRLYKKKRATVTVLDRRTNMGMASKYGFFSPLKIDSINHKNYGEKYL